MVKVSIIVPVYNVENYLRECLDSLVNQTLQDIEIICINDGSTDNSLAILQEYSAKDSRIQVISKNNEGQGVARNNGIDIASGEYIAFVDSDDYCEINMYEKLYNTAKEFDADLVECCYKKFNDIDGLITQGIPLTGIPYDKLFSWSSLKEKSPIFVNTPVPWNKLVKVSFLRENQIYFAKSKYAEDFYFSIRARLLANKIIHIEDELYIYRIRPMSTMGLLSTINHKNQPQILAETKQFLINKGFYAELETQFEINSLSQLAKSYICTPDEYKNEFEENVKNLLGNRMLKMLKRKMRFRFLRKIFIVGNETQDGKRYKVLKIFGYGFRLKRLY